MLLESVKYLIVTHAVTGKLRPLDSIKVAFVGKYYDDITPFSAGGQPMQIVYLHKKGHSTGTSSAIILIKYFIQMMCWVSICFFLMILNRGVLDKYVTGELYGIPTKQMLVIAGWIGWAVNAILPCSIVFFAIFPKFTNKVLEGCISIVINISWRAANRRERKTEENKDDVPAWAQALIDSNKSLSDKLTQFEMEKAQATRSQQILAKAKEYGIPENYAKRCAIKDDEDLDAYFKGVTPSETAEEKIEKESESIAKMIDERTKTIVEQNKN